jgi:hypothetical protein
MEEKRQSRLEAAIIIAVALLPLWLLVAYVAGYYKLSTVSVTTQTRKPSTRFRIETRLSR